MSTNTNEEPRHLADEKFDVVKFVKITAVLIISLLLWNLPSTVFGIEGLTVIEQRMISIFAFAALMWITEGVPAWVTSVLIIVVMLFTVSDSSISMLIDLNNYQGAATEVNAKGVEQLQGLIPYKDIIAAFADPTVMLFMGGFILALVASKSGVDISLARVMLKPFGTNSKRVLFGFMLVTAIFSMFISNTATAAMMLTFLAPVFRTLPENERGRVGLALAIPIGCNIGGIGTPIGTPPNGIALGALKDAGFNIGFLDWMIMMVPLMLLILVIAWLLLLNLYKFKSETLEFKIEGGAKPGWQTKAIYVVMAMTIALWCLEKVVGINSYVVALFPVGAFTALGIVSSEDIKHIDWSVLWMVAGGFALGTGMKQSGLAKAMVESIPFAEFNVFVVLIGAGLLCWLLSTFISNSASAALMVPILITVGTGMSEQLAPIGGVVTLVAGLALSASFAMALPISTPPNAIAYSTGLVKTSQMAKVGIIMGVIAMTLAYGMLMLFGSMGIGIFG
ncbi:MAG: SLC13 family permease [Bacteroidales bacterium]|nr:SLC13 family permease [Bacteroidales bacterium]